VCNLVHGVISLAVLAAGWVGSSHPEITPPNNFHHPRDTTLQIWPISLLSMGESPQKMMHRFGRSPDAAKPEPPPVDVLDLRSWEGSSVVFAFPATLLRNTRVISISLKNRPEIAGLENVLQNQRTKQFKGES
ncbi:hypothetical protein, partial [Thioclava marina]|uniref:hypothetical protein n=1 Tax=Thioclava marina TaxID=1915077 RepID=UPI0023528E7C